MTGGCMEGSTLVHILVLTASILMVPGAGPQELCVWTGSADFLAGTMTSTAVSFATGGVVLASHPTNWTMFVRNPTERWGSGSDTPPHPLAPLRGGRPPGF